MGLYWTVKKVLDVNMRGKRNKAIKERFAGNEFMLRSIISNNIVFFFRILQLSSDLAGRGELQEVKDSHIKCSVLSLAFIPPLCQRI